MRAAIAIAAALLWAHPALAGETVVSHALSLFDDIKYPPGFSHFAYVNPDAPKGGEVRLSALGTFDSLNGYVIKGSAAAGTSLLYDTLMEPSRDEASTEYGLLAESVEVPDDNSWVAFTLREGARWHDGKPVTAEDVVFTFQTLKEKGAPGWGFYYANVAKAEKVAPRTVRFTFAGRPNRELPLIVGQLPVLPRHYWEGREFDATTLEPPLGSGPYRVVAVDPGRSITYELVQDYWGRELPVMRGRYNYGRVRFEYYRDPTVALEAFKSSGFDFRQENSAKVWATGYDFPAARDGRVVVETLPDNNPTGMQSFAFNLRRWQFQDARVRWALAHAFDFEWSNKNLFYGQYTRTESFFSNSDLASEGLPGEAELKYLEPLRGRVPDEVFTKAYRAPQTDGSGNIRGNLRTAQRLLREAGWEVRGGKLVHGESGRQMEIEFLLVSPDFERVVAPLLRNLERLGVKGSIRVVDSSQYRRRLDTFDFDAVVASWGQSLSPGNEQRDFWGSEAADREGSRNWVGIKNPAIDQLIDEVIFAPDRPALVAATRALDRVLLWHHYVIPQWHLQHYRIAYWNRFSRPAVKPKYDLGFFDTWWVDPAKDHRLARAGKAN